MVKETKFFRKQAEKAARMARGTADEDVSQRYASLAQAYRSQADALKKTKKLKAKKEKLSNRQTLQKPKGKKTKR